MQTADRCIQHKLQRSLTCFAVTWLMVTPALSSAQAHIDHAPRQSEFAPSTSVHLTLASAIEMALEHNRRLMLADDAVRDSNEQKRIAQSRLYPILKNQSAVLHITELEDITIPAGALAPASPIGPLPAASLAVFQGEDTAYTSGTELAQPLTQLFRIRAGVRAAEADLRTAKIQSEDAGNGIALQVRQLYYGTLIEQARAQAAEAAVDAAILSGQEAHQGVEDGRLLEEAELARQADILEKKQAALVSRLNLDDLTLRLDDAIGLLLGTKVDLDADALGTVSALPTRAEAMALAVDRSPTILTARQTVERARAGLAAARDAYLPDVTGLARYSYQSGVPFLPHNFGTFGATVTYDLFNGGAREANLRSARLKLHMAETQLQQSENDVRIEVSTAYDKAEELAQLLDVTTQASAARKESFRIRSSREKAGAELPSAVAAARAALASSNANVLDSQLNLLLVQNDIKRLMGERPE